MTKVRKILSVIALCAFLFVVGYSCYTGRRLAGYPQTLDGYKNTTFYGNDGDRVAFTDGYAWYGTSDGIFLLEVQSYTDGVIFMTDGEKEYVFTAVGKDTLYDVQTEEFLRKGG